MTKVEALAARGPQAAKLARAMQAMSRKGWTTEDVRRAAKLAHSRDEDCTLDATDSCSVCGVYHGDPCPVCGGRGFHRDGCERIDAEPAERS